jgi:hypothetical protein
MQRNTDYNCDVCECFQDIYNGFVFDFDITLSEAKLWAKAKRDDCKILKGQRYIKQRQIVDGRFWTFRARLEID